MTRNYFSDKSILLISSEDWSHISLSKHHYALALANVGARVYFLNPPGMKWNLQPHPELSNLFIVDYKAIKGVNFMPAFLRNALNRMKIRKIKGLWSLSFDVVWSFDPFRFQNLALFDARVKIYHPVDIHIARLEKEIAASADLIFSVSELILRRFHEAKGLKFKIDHGLQSHFLSDDHGAVSPQVKVVGYMGNLDNYCIDIETMMRIVKENQKLIFHFIGPYRKDSPLANQLKEYKHCVLFGRVPSDKLPEFFKKPDMFLMTYDGSDKEVNSNHHKILEYLSTGKPVVINFTDEYKKRRDIVCMSDNNNELPELFKSVVGNFGEYIKDDVRRKRIDFARSNTYDAHVNRIAKIIEKDLNE